MVLGQNYNYSEVVAFYLSHRKSIIRISFLVGAILLFLKSSIFGMELSEIKSGNQLAHFIYSMTKGDVPIEVMLKGLKYQKKLKIPDYETEIPVREVFATIVIERFGEQLEEKLFKSNKTYATRAICAFRDSKDDVWRFTVSILEEKQYGLLIRFLENRLKHTRKNI